MPGTLRSGMVLSGRFNRNSGRPYFFCHYSINVFTLGGVINADDAYPEKFVVLRHQFDDSYYNFRRKRGLIAVI